jgi:hypothetical protein
MQFDKNLAGRRNKKVPLELIFLRDSGFRVKLNV